MHKIGLKIWSTNTSYIIPALELYKKGVFSYIELFIVPGSAKELLQRWRKEDFPFMLHAPHSYSGFNLSLSDFELKNRLLMKEIDSFRIVLNPKQVIFHPGSQGSLDETIRQINLLKKDFPEVFDLAILENKPKIGLNGENCMGASPEEMERLLIETSLGFCLDIGHAVCYAAWARIEIETVIENFLKLNPIIFHLSDGDIDSQTDSHLNFGKGNIDLCRLIQMIPSNAYVSIETDKDEKLNLKDFENDAAYFKKCIC